MKFIYYDGHAVHTIDLPDVRSARLAHAPLADDIAALAYRARTIGRENGVRDPDGDFRPATDWERLAIALDYAADLAQHAERSAK